MERIMSSEEKIRRAEEIYARRHEGYVKPTTNINVSTKNNPKLLKKMVLQIIACLCIYLIIYTVHNNNYIFSQDFINKANDILSYDTNFMEIYQKAKSFVLDFGQNDINNEIIPPQETSQEGGIGGSDETKENEQKPEEISNESDVQSSEQVVLSQEEQDIINVKNTTTFIKPVSRNYKFKIWTKRAYN